MQPISVTGGTVTELRYALQTYDTSTGSWVPSAVPAATFHADHTVLTQGLTSDKLDVTIDSSTDTTVRVYKVRL